MRRTHSAAGWYRLQLCLPCWRRFSCGSHTWAAVALIAAFLVALLAVAGALWPSTRPMPRIVPLPAFAIAANVAVVHSIWRRAADTTITCGSLLYGPARDHRGTRFVAEAVSVCVLVRSEFAFQLDTVQDRAQHADGKTVQKLQLGSGHASIGLADP